MNITTKEKLLGVLIITLGLIYIPFVISNAVSGKTFLKGDCSLYESAVISIIENGDLKLENNLKNPTKPISNVAVNFQGEIVPKHSILMPLLSIPFYLLIPNSYVLLFFNLCASIVLMLIVFKLNLLFFNPVSSLVSTLLYAVCTLFLDYTYNYSPDLIASIFFLGGIYFALCRRFYVAIFLMGISVFAKAPNIIFLIPLLFYIFWNIFIRHKPENRPVLLNGLFECGILMVVFLTSLLPFFFTNYYLFDSPFITGYHRAVSSYYSVENYILENHQTAFNSSIIHDGIQILFHYSKGLLTTNPILIFSIIGLFFVVKTKALNSSYILLLSVIFSQFIFYVFYDYSLASHFSNRFFMISIAISSVFFTYFLQHHIVPWLSKTVTPVI